MRLTPCVCAFFSACSRCIQRWPCVYCGTKELTGRHTYEQTGSGTERLEQAEKGGSSKPHDSAETEWLQDTDDPYLFRAFMPSCFLFDVSATVYIGNLLFFSCSCLLSSCMMCIYHQPCCSGPHPPALGSSLTRLRILYHIRNIVLIQLLLHGRPFLSLQAASLT